VASLRRKSRRWPEWRKTYGAFEFQAPLSSAMSNGLNIALAAVTSDITTTVRKVADKQGARPGCLT
jgi:hypothetical protein